MDALWIIKSFKHDGSLHRMWRENWRVPDDALAAGHAAEKMTVFVNSQTPIREADGSEWVSKVPAVSFFIPKQWYNIVALIEESGIRYYCNVASPPYISGRTLTYIDYDLDVILFPDRTRQVVDQQEYETHSRLYRYTAEVKAKVAEGLQNLTARMEGGGPPFDDDAVRQYYERWKAEKGRGAP